MRKLLFVLIFTAMCTFPVQALEITAPEAPRYAQEYMPEESLDLGSALWRMAVKAMQAVRPDLKEASRICLGLIATVLLICVLQNLSEQVKRTAVLTGTAAIGAALLMRLQAMVPLATKTINGMCDYAKLLLPVMTSAMAAQGAAATSASLYTGTAVLITGISQLVSRFFVPAVYLYLALAIGSSACGEPSLRKIGDLVKWAVSWCLKTVMTLFTAYMSLTGVVSGTADAASVKAIKAAVSTAVPVVGGILSNATESVLVGAALMKNAAGIYGIFAVLAIGLEPFLRIGAHYLMLKLTVGLCGVFGSKEMTGLMGDFTSGLGLLLGMTGSVCILLLISTVCFLKGVG